MTSYILFGFAILVLLFLHYIKNFNSIESTETDLSFSKKNYVLLVLSFIGLFFGGKIFLDNSLAIFSYFGISEAVIGITILAIGTSLPELITVGVSYLRKKSDIGVGNILGSNMMNILFVFFPGVIITNLQGYDFILSSININYLILLFLATLIIVLLSFLKITLSKLISSLFLFFYFVYIYWILI